LAEPQEDVLKIGRLPRILNSGVDYNDLQKIIQGSPGDMEWSRRWEEFGAMHEELGDQALKDGSTRSAGEAFVRAAVYYHTGQSGNHSDPSEKARLQHRQQEVYRKGMPYLRPPAEQLVIPYKGISFPGNLRIPEGAGSFPCVLLLAGADSTKEEFYTLENTFLVRGVATFSFDGPGQSLTRATLPYTADVETSIAACLDVLEKHPRIDGARFGIWGRSLGGYGAPRAAALDSRIKACVSAGGFYDMHESWLHFPAVVRTNLGKVIGAHSPEEAETLAKGFSLAGLMPRVTCPFLVIHSHGDIVCSYKDGERMAREAKGPTEIHIFPEGDHACDNISYKVRPFTADWLARHLGVAAL
jgi:dipeptidyl aminopeptidase/acylaminoacyl peptidase